MATMATISSIPTKRKNSLTESTQLRQLGTPRLPRSDASYHEQYFRKLVGKSNNACYHLCDCVVDMLASDAYFSVKTSTVDLRAARLTIWVVLALWVSTHQPLDSVCFAQLFRRNVKTSIPREVYLVIKNARKIFADSADQLASWLGVPRSWFFDQPYQPDHQPGHQPGKPGNPGKPGKPGNPGKPGKPGKPDQPHQPVKPDQDGRHGCQHQVISSLSCDVCRLCGMCLAPHLVPDFQTTQMHQSGQFGQSCQDDVWDTKHRTSKSAKFGMCDEKQSKCTAQQRWEVLLAKLHSVRLPVRTTTTTTTIPGQTGKFVTTSMPDVFVQYMFAVFQAQVKANCAYQPGPCGKMFLVVYTALAALGYQDTVFRRGWVSKSVVVLVEPDQQLLSQSVVQPGMLCDMTQAKQFANQFVEQVDKLADKQCWQSEQLKLVRTPAGALVIKHNKSVVNVTIRCDWALDANDVGFFIDKRQLVLIDTICHTKPTGASKPTKPTNLCNQTCATNPTNATNATNLCNQTVQTNCRNCHQFRFFVPDNRAGLSSLMVKNVVLKVHVGSKNAKFHARHADKLCHPDFPSLVFAASIWASQAYPVQFKQVATILPVDMCCFQ